MGPGKPERFCSYLPSAGGRLVEIVLCLELPDQMAHIHGKIN